jgi:hypothetical protein
MPDPCPRCGRPVALARASCLYCGAPLEAGQVPAAAAQALPAPDAPPPEREVVILDLRDAAPLDLAEALGVTAYDAAQRVRRGGYQLQRIASPPSARGEAERLRAAGLRVIVVPEADVRTAAEPLLAQGGLFEDGALALRTEAGPRRVLGPEVLLIVRGPIARAAEPTPQTRRIRVAGPSEGQRIHLHLRQDRRPVEIDPDDFECGAAPLPGSSLVMLIEWVRALGSEAPVDDGFRHLAPALAPALPAPATAAGTAEALAPPRRGKAARPVLFDNVAQFRFYSGWRAAVERLAERT